MLHAQTPAPERPCALHRPVAGNCSSCAVRARAICAGLTPDERDVLAREGRTMSVRRGQTLLWEGEDAPLVGNVLEGVMKLSTSTSDGREQIVGVVYPADFIGRPFGARSSHSVTALVDAKLCVFPRGSFDRFAREHPELEHRLLARALDELDRARRWMLLLGRKSASERVVSFLLELSERLGESSADNAPLAAFDLPLDRQQIADILGLTIETVSRQFSALRAAGIVELPSRRAIQILSRERLVALSGD